MAEFARPTRPLRPLVVRVLLTVLFGLAVLNFVTLLEYRYAPEPATADTWIIAPGLERAPAPHATKPSPEHRRRCGRGYHKRERAHVIVLPPAPPAPSPPVIRQSREVRVTTSEVPPRPVDPVAPEGYLAHER